MASRNSTDAASGNRDREKKHTPASQVTMTKSVFAHPLGCQCENDRLRNESTQKVLSAFAHCEKVLLYSNSWLRPGVSGAARHAADRRCRWRRYARGSRSQVWLSTPRSETGHRLAGAV